MGHGHTGGGVMVPDVDGAVRARGGVGPRLARGLGLAASLVVCVLLPLLMVVANKSAPAVLGLAAVLANAAVLAADEAPALLVRYRGLLGAGTTRCLVLVATLATLSLAWSIDPAMSRRGLAEALPEALFGFSLAAAWPLVLVPGDLKLLRLGLIGAALLIVVESSFGMALHHLVGARAQSFDMKRSAVPVVLMLWPALAIHRTREQRPWAVALVVAAIAAAVFAHAAAAVVSVILSLLVFVAARQWPRPVLNGFAIGAFVLLALAPWTGTLVGTLLPPRAQSVLQDQHASHRVEIWTAFGRHVGEAPIIGHGFDTSFRIADRMALEDTDPAMFDDKVIDNIHPHNVLLQVWVEFGLVGAVGAAAAIGLMVRRLHRLNEADRAFRLAFLASTAAVALVGLNAWSPWWLAVEAVCLVMFFALRSGAGATAGIGAAPVASPGTPRNA